MKSISKFLMIVSFSILGISAVLGFISTNYAFNPYNPASGVWNNILVASVISCSISTIVGLTSAIIGVGFVDKVDEKLKKKRICLLH